MLKTNTINQFLKNSKYNVVIKDLECNKYLLYNTLRNSVGVLDENGVSIYEKLDSDNISKSEFILDKDIKIIDTMVKNGFVVDKDFNEDDLLEKLISMNRNGKHTLSITIATTLLCNIGGHRSTCYFRPLRKIVNYMSTYDY
ncbi:MAG: hypothetical protein ACRCXT_07635 [Paraclostridium sp.]